MSAAHYHRHGRDHAHAVRTDDDELVSSEVGIMHPASVKFGFAVMVLVFAAALGVMIWAAVVLADEKPYYAPNATTEPLTGYVVYYDRAAEPYCGQPARVLTGVDTSGTCVSNCDADANCRFFTFDQTHARCYMYEGGVLPGQLAAAAVPGPTTQNSYVYVKDGSLSTQLRGVLRNGNQTLF